MRTPARVVVLAAHPDDADFRCSGTISTWVDAGADATLIVFTDGSKGSHDTSLTDEAVGLRRRQEQVTAAEVVGYRSVEFLGHEDGRLERSEGLVQQVVGRLRELRPEVVLSYDPWTPYEMHPDHTVAGEIAFRACIRSREARFYPNSVAPHWPVANLLLFGTAAPDLVTDVDATIDRKIAAILCHETQFTTEMGFEPGDNDGRERFVSSMRAMAERSALGQPFSYGEEFKCLEVS